MTGYDGVPPDHKQEQKTENTTANNSLAEWAEKIYRASEKVWKKLIAFQHFPEAEEAEKFRNEMHGKKFGRFISVLQSKSGILYLKIGDHEIATDYFPSRHHIEKIKNFLSERGEKSTDFSQQILMQLATVPIVARMIRGKILYPEIKKLENKIAESEKIIKEILNQLEINLDMWNYLGHNIDSEIRQGTPLFYSTRNKLAEWRNKFKKE